MMTKESDSRDDALATLLHETMNHARAGRTAALMKLIELGLPVGLRDQKGDTLLMIAAYHGHRDTAAALLARGADPDAINDRGQRPLAGVAFKGDRAMAALLVAHGARVDARDGAGRTALMFAAMFDRVEIVRLLLGLGADPALVDEGGVSALTLAENMGAEGAAALLRAALDEV